MKPYKECKSCIATSWCKIHSGEVVGSRNPWCSAKFRLDSALKLSRIPKIYKEANMYNYKEDEDNKKISQFLSEVVDNIVSVIDEGTNFFFFGATPGTGKTYSAFVILNHYIYKTCVSSKFDFENPLGVYVVHADLIDDLRYRRDLDEVQNILKQINEVPLLIMDDIGSGTSSAFSRDQTYLIMNNRMNNGLSTIYTSNLTIAELRKPEVLGARNVSRLISNAVGIEFNGKDRRLFTARGARK